MRKSKTTYLATLFAVFVAMTAVIGIRFFDNGMLWLRWDGRYTEYQDGIETVYTTKPLFAKTEYARLDVVGDEEAARAGIGALLGKVLWEERIDDLLILYAYSPYMTQYEEVLGCRVNLMVAVRGDRVSFGTPLLKGSY